MATKSKSAGSKAIAQVAAQAPAPAPAAAPAPAKVVALRGGAAVQSIKLSGNPYRTGAPHNQLWWATISKACEGGKAAEVAKLLASKENPNGVPAHFIGYTLRRGYLTAV
jgi:hypothetical protein